MQKWLNEYGMLLVLLLLCAFFSLATLKEQHPQGAAAAAQVAAAAGRAAPGDALVLVVGSDQEASRGCAEGIAAGLRAGGRTNLFVATGTPPAVRRQLEALRAAGRTPAAVAMPGDVTEWLLWKSLPQAWPAFAGVPRVSPRPYRWPDFLKPSNLLAVVDRIVVIAVIAIGMTMVIITAGIDLSVGSLIALSAVVSTMVMKQLGGLAAPAWAVAAGFLAGIAVCGALGALGGIVVARFRVAPFITSLALMMIARGLARILTGEFSIYQVPKALPWLGQGRSLGIPNTVLLLAALYVVAHVFMSRTKLGRYIYAVGGNEEAARLSGVPVQAVVVLVYVVSGLMAGIGGCIQASQLNTGTPNCGQMYEMYVIAAVVVGGTSLAGGSGRILGTLIGAFIISVIQNGMNLLGIKDATQMVVLGLVILGAVLMDKLRGGGSLAFRGRRGRAAGAAPEAPRAGQDERSKP